ncbi:MAG: AP2 domain-containing protein [Phycisphaerae bacterium]|nr:AP2 domain-containing protein [Phycisphaerae bacterium]
MVKIYFHNLVGKVCAHIGVWILLQYRKKRYGCAFRKIKLTRGKYAKVSPEDFAEINKHKWQAINNQGDTFYAIRSVRTGGKKKRIYMHREIMKPPTSDITQGGKRIVVDHKDGDGLNNTRENLRIATARENAYNRKKYRKKCSSKYKGVSQEKKSKKWRAIIYHKRRKIHLGMFDSETEAAKAYDKAARELFGEYAKLNFTQ